MVDREVRKSQLVCVEREIFRLIRAEGVRGSRAGFGHVIAPLGATPSIADLQPRFFLFRQLASLGRSVQQYVSCIVTI